MLILFLFILLYHLYAIPFVTYRRHTFVVLYLLNPTFSFYIQLSSFFIISFTCPRCSSRHSHYFLHLHSIPFFYRYLHIKIFKAFTKLYNLQHLFYYLSSTPMLLFIYTSMYSTTVFLPSFYPPLLRPPRFSYFTTVLIIFFI